MSTTPPSIPPGADSGSSRTSPLKRIRVVLIAFLLCIAAGLTAAYWMTGYLDKPYKGFTAEQKLLYIPPGTPTRDAVQKLHSEGILASEWAALAYLWWHRQRGGIKAGEYQFQQALSARDVLEKLIHGRVYYHTLTVPEGWNLRQVASLLKSQEMGSETEIAAALRNVALIRDWDDLAEDLEGYLFPDTYFYTRGTQAAEIVRKMVSRFRIVFTEDWRRRAAELRLGIRGVVTLASLVEKETGAAPERPLISSVFHRRLARGILLQCDPTVIYAAESIGQYDGKIHRSDLQLNSPYNTYLYPGLPPGPIANPGARSLEAALYPAAVNYLYFVSRNDGTHQFSETLAAHNQAVRVYQR